MSLSLFVLLVELSLRNTGTGFRMRNENPNQVPKAPKIYVMKSMLSIFGFESIVKDGL